MNTYDVNGFYGSNQTPCTVYVYERNDYRWYVVEDSVNVNCTYDAIEEGCNIETLEDHDFFTATKPVLSTDDLEREVDEL